MKEGIDKKIIPTAIKASEEHRMILKQLLVLGNELHKLDEDASVRRHQEQSPDPEIMQKIERARNVIESYMPLIREALTHDRLLPEALAVCDTLITTVYYELRIAERIADTAFDLEKQLEQHSEHTEKILQLMTEAFMSIGTHGGFREKLPKSAKKIRHALEKAQPALELFFSEANQPSAQEIKKRMRALHDVILVCNEEKSVWALDLFAQHIVWLIHSKDYIPQYSSHTALRILFADIKSQGNVLHDIPRHAVTRFDIEGMLESFEPPQALAIIQAAVRRFGIPADMYNDDEKPEGVISVFRSSNYFSRVFDQFETIQLLEKERPGSVKELYARFGIRWFTRYPASVLIKQYDERDSSEKPYGAFVTAQFDWNEAFFSENDRRVIEGLSRHLESTGHTIRFIECDGKRELVLRLSALDADYGAHHKISFLFIRAHASRGHVEFGKDDKDGDLELKDLNNKHFVERLQVFKEHPYIIFDGCSVGRRGGIAERLSSVLSATTFAPKGLTSALVDIHVHKKDGELVFSPTYEATEGAGETPHVYVKGRKR